MEQEQYAISPVRGDDDLAAVGRLAAEIWPSAYGRILSAGQIAYMLKMMYRPDVIRKEMDSGVRFDLLRRGNTPLGFVSYGSYEPEGTAKLHKIYLLPVEHGKGLGKLLLNHAVCACRTLGFRRLVLNVNKYNETAQQFYCHSGFRRIDSVRVDIGNGFFMDDYIMEKPL